MATINVLDSKGKKVRDFNFADGFLPENPHTHLMHLHVVRQMRHRRAGTASTLTRDEVSGGGKKPWKQKGTGRARTGSIRSPIRKGGGVIFGPKPRKYTMNLSVKARRLALRSAVLAQLPQTVGIDSFGLSKPSTKAMDQLLTKTFSAAGKVLVVVKEHDENVTLSARNLQRVKVILANNLSVRDLLNVDHIVATEAALQHIQEVFK